MFRQPSTIRRELVPGSLEVYPIKNYGAIEVGSHRSATTRSTTPILTGLRLWLNWNSLHWLCCSHLLRLKIALQLEDALTQLLAMATFAAFLSIPRHVIRNSNFGPCKKCLISALKKRSWHRACYPKGIVWERHVEGTDIPERDIPSLTDLLERITTGGVIVVDRAELLTERSHASGDDRPIAKRRPHR